MNKPYKNIVDSGIMSSRALRKLQKEREQQKQLETQDEQNEQGDESEDEAIPTTKARNAFDMLNEAEEEDDEASEDGSVTQDTHPDVPPPMDSSALSKQQNAKSKAKKKKSKKKGKVTERVGVMAKDSAPANDQQLDEIDLALQSLPTNKTAEPVDPLESTKMAFEEANLYLYRLLAVESKHLNALNEMRRLFGNVVTENEDETAGTPRRRGRGVQHLDLGGALAGRHSPASHGQGLAGLALRRNPFVLGKEEWPKATSGGLGMELVEKMNDGTIEYRFVHNSFYQDVQRQFEICVESMDPQRMISLLQYNPYHISTLLQVSEIAKQQGDHSVSGDLLERALFSFGRSVQSSFTTALRQGKARLDFRRPENREFWLAAWRFTNNLGQRGTWRTAYEWARLILSLDPEGDPYCISLMIDQIALRGGQSEHFLKLANCSFLRDELWLPRINVRISSALAEYKLKQAQQSRVSLTKCVNSYPWVFARLFQELNIDHVPKAIWGRTAKSERDQLECELYVHNAKDLWNTPEAISFLVEVVEATDTPLPDPGSKEGESVSLDEARYVVLSGIPSLLNLIPRRFTTMPSSSSDPLPPPDNLPSYDPAPPADSQSAYASPFARTADDDSETSDEGTPNPRSPEDNEHNAAQQQDPQSDVGFIGRMMRRIVGRPGPAQTDLSQLAREMERLEDDNQQRLHEARQAAPTPGPAYNAEFAAHVARFQAELEDRSSDEGEAQNQSELGQNSQSAPYDEEKNKRWLAGQGLSQLKSFTAAHGTDESTWHGGEQSIVNEYARRVLQLRERRQRTFILDITLGQGAGVAVKELVGREIGRLEG